MGGEGEGLMLCQASRRWSEQQRQRPSSHPMPLGLSCTSPSCYPAGPAPLLGQPPQPDCPSEPRRWRRPAEPRPTGGREQQRNCCGWRPACLHGRGPGYRCRAAARAAAGAPAGRGGSRRARRVKRPARQHTWRPCLLHDSRRTCIAFDVACPALSVSCLLPGVLFC